MIVRRLVAVLVASLLTLVVSTGVAAAHSKLESMTPADGSTQAAPPTQVVLTFNEPVASTGAEVQVKSPSGANVSTGQLTVIDKSVTQPVGAMIEVGKYTVDARIVSADGHPITVSASFTITHAGHAAVPAPTPATPDSGSNAVVIVAAVLVMLVVVALSVVIVRRRPGPESS